MLSLKDIKSKKFSTYWWPSWNLLENNSLDPSKEFCENIPNFLPRFSDRSEPLSLFLIGISYLKKTNSEDNITLPFYHLHNTKMLSGNSSLDNIQITPPFISNSLLMFQQILWKLLIPNDQPTTVSWKYIDTPGKKRFKKQYCTTEKIILQLVLIIHHSSKLSILDPSVTL